MLSPTSAIKRTNKMFNEFKKVYVKDDFHSMFERPDVFAIGYNLDKIDPNTNVQARCAYIPERRNKYTITYNYYYWITPDNLEIAKGIEDDTIIHEFAHYIVYYELFRFDETMRFRRNTQISSESALTILREPYTDEYFDWDDCIRPMWYKFIESIYNNYNVQERTNISTFFLACEFSYQHLSLAFYRACYLCWRLFYKDRKRGIPSFSFKKILGYDSDKLQQQLIDETLNKSLLTKNLI